MSGTSEFLERVGFGGGRRGQSAKHSTSGAIKTAAAVGASLGATALALVVSGALATVGPSSFIPIDGNIRLASAPSTTTPYDWANNGTAYDSTTCSNLGVHAVGTGGLFDCGKAVAPTSTNTNPVPLAPTLTATAAADPSIVSSAFVVDPLFNSNTKNTGLTCPVTGASTTAGDPTATTSGASKNDLPLNGFVYTPTSLQPKDDLGDVYAVAHRATGVNEVFFGAERITNKGASHVDFEFLQSPITLVPASSTACNGNFTGHRTGGDFLATTDFTTGGSLGAFTIYEWSCDGTVTGIMEGTQCDPSTSAFPSAFPNAAYVAAPAANAAAFSLQVNGSGSVPCGGWVCRDSLQSSSQVVSQNEFMEGGVNLNTLGFRGCISTLFPHTRSSPDINSTLQDFAGPIAFNTCSINTTPAAAATDVHDGPITDNATVSGFLGTPGFVNFNLYGPFASSAAISSSSCTSSNNVFSSGPVGTTDTASPAHYTATTTSAPPGIGVYQWVASYSTTSGGAVEASGACGDTSEQVRVVDANIQISPLTKDNEVGTNHTLTGHVNISSGTSYVNAPAGTTINFSFQSNPNGATFVGGVNSCSTILATGSCTVQITASTAGTDVVRASTTVTDIIPLSRHTGDALCEPTPGQCDSGDATKNWVDATIAITPLTPTNAVGTPEVFTVTFTAKPAGTAVTFNSITRTVTPTPDLASTSTCGAFTVSGNTATCTITINSSTAGTFTVHVTGSVTEGSVTLSRSTGDTAHGDSGDAVKTYVDGRISISPPTPTNAVGATETFTVTVLLNKGDGNGFVAAPGISVLASKSDSNGASSSFTTPTTCETTGPASTPDTDANGQCTVSITSSSAGQTTVNATFTTTINGASITRTTGDNKSGDSSSALKTWVDGRITITPPTPNDAVGDTETFTVTVLLNYGDGNGFVAAPNIPVLASKTDSNGASSSFATPTTCETTGPATTQDTDSNGQCTVSITSLTAGQTTVSATFTTSINGATITRTTGDNKSGDSSKAVKTWVDAYITLALQNTPDPVGSTENVTASVFVNDGSGSGYVAAASKLVNLSIIGTSVGNFVPSGSTASCTTGVSGTCVVQITSNVKGTTTVRATTTVTVLGVSLTRTTNDGISFDGNDIVKTWTPVSPPLTTSQSADGPIGSTTITDTATITNAFGQAGSSDKVTFQLYGPFTSAPGASDCTLAAKTSGYTPETDTFSGGNAGLSGQTWSATTAVAFHPTSAGYYAWIATPDFTGDSSNNAPPPNACGSEVVHITPVAPTLTTSQTSPSSIVINTPATISDTAQLHNFVLLQSGDTVTFGLFGPFTGSGTPVCDTATNTNRVLGPFSGLVNTTSGAASSGSQTFTPTAAGTYYWVATFSGDVNNTPVNATNVGCGDSHEAVVVTAPTAQITPTGTTCAQFRDGTSTTLSTISYSTSGANISTDNPGVFFYYDKVSLSGGNDTIRVTESITSSNTFPSGQSNYLLPVLNSSTSQVILYDATSCATISNTTVTIPATQTDNSYPVTIQAPANGNYIFSIKYTPKTLVGLRTPSPTTIVYSFTGSVDNVGPIGGSTQTISAVKSP
jgi:hypothetical protein